MSQQLDPQFYRDFSGGMATDLNETLAPKNTSELIQNFELGENIGSLVGRYGTSINGTQTVDAKTCLGLHGHINPTTSANNRLFMVVNNSGDTQSVVYRVGTGAVTGWTTLTASKKARFLTYLGETLLLNGTDAPSAWNETAVITTGGAFDLANLPGTSEPKYCIEFLSRVYVAGDASAPSTVYYSGAAAANAVSWTSGNGSVIIEQEDNGGDITGFGKVPNYLLVFKERSMSRWNFRSAFPEELITIGTPSQESVIIAGGVCGFFSASSEEMKGFYITNGGRPRCISKNRGAQIKKWVDAIPAAFYDDVAGIGTEDYMMWSVGDLTVDGRTFNNVLLKYYLHLDAWVIRSYPTEFRFFTKYIVSSKVVTIGGDDDGQAIQLDDTTVFTDYPSTTPIQLEYNSHEEDFGFNQKKVIKNKMALVTRDNTGLTVSVKPDQRDPVPLGEGLAGDIVDITLSRNIEGNYFKTIIRGQQTGERIVLKQIEYPSIEVNDNYT